MDLGFIMFTMMAKIILLCGFVALGTYGFTALYYERKIEKIREEEILHTRPDKHNTLLEYLSEARELVKNINQQ